MATATLAAAVLAAAAVSAHGQDGSPGRGSSLAPMMVCPGTAILQTEMMTTDDYDAVFKSIKDRYDTLPTACNGTFCPQADWTGCVLRAAGHDFMDFEGGRGGSDGCLDFDDVDNRGLEDCLWRGEFGVSVAQSYAEFCERISLADFMVIAGEVVISITRQNHLEHFPDAPTIDFKSGFQFGRKTAEHCPWAVGLLPDPEESCAAVERNFINALGLNWDQATALSGVHTLGRAHINNSGYDGFWMDAENSRRFNNFYYTSLIDKGWRPESVAGNPRRNQWIRSDLGRDDRQGKEMMLNTDMCLTYVVRLPGSPIRPVNAWTELYNRSYPGGPCCAWRWATNMGHTIRPPRDDLYYINGTEHCGVINPPQRNGEEFNIQRDHCCGSPSQVEFRDCQATTEIANIAPGGQAVQRFSLNETAFLVEFLDAWRHVTTNGVRQDLQPLLRPRIWMDYALIGMVVALAIIVVGVIGMGLAGVGKKNSGAKGQELLSS